MANHHGRRRGTPDMEQVTQATLPKLLARNACDLADWAAIRVKEYGIWRVWNWRQVQAETLAIAAGLAALGVERGAPVVIVGDNRPQLYWSVCAAQALGAVPVPVFQEANAAEMGFVIDHAQVDLAIAEDQEQVDKLLAIRARYGRPRQIVVKDERGLSDTCGYQESHPTWRKGMNGVRTGHAVRTY
jgi:long-chain acyl-CoA synthetase